MIKWIKPNGVELETNEHEPNILQAEEYGWKRVDAEKTPEEMTKKELETFVKEKFGVDLDLRKSMTNLLIELSELESVE